MPIPSHKPAQGYGTQERSGGKVYEYTFPGRWVEIGSYGPIGSQTLLPPSPQIPTPPPQATTPSGGGDGGGGSPGGITKGSYDPASLTQGQRQWLWEQFGHSGEASVGYGGEDVGGGDGGGDPAQQFADQYAKSLEEMWGKETSWIERNIEQNPFAFDEELAKRSATAEYEPYYSELLDDYLADVGVKRETLEDEQRLLKALRTTPTGTAGEFGRSYERAVAQAEQGFAGRGMFFSGIKKRALGGAEVEREAGIREMATGALREERGVERQQEQAIAGGLETRRGEKLREYWIPRMQEYKREFPTGGRLEGYLPEQFLMYRA